MRCSLRSRYARADGDLLNAVRQDDAPTVRALLAPGTDPNTRDEANVPVLMHATAVASLTTVRSLLDAGADVNGATRNGATPLKGYDNPAFVPVDFGFEVQIDELARPDGAEIHRMGAIYRADGRTDNETLTLQPAHAPGEWNDYEITVQNQVYTVMLNGQQVCVFDNTTTYPGRGLPSTAAVPSYFGLQVYADPRALVAFRRVRIKAL